MTLFQLADMVEVLRPSSIGPGNVISTTAIGRLDELGNGLDSTITMDCLDKPSK